MILVEEGACYLRFVIDRTHLVRWSRRAAQRPWSNLLPVVLAAFALVGCDRVVPSPWKELGVPKEHLAAVDAGSTDEVFSAVYADDDAHVADAFGDGLSHGGLTLCGKAVRVELQMEAFFNKGETFFHLTVSPLDGHRSQVILSKTKFNRGMDRALSESGCEVPGLRLKSED